MLLVLTRSVDNDVHTPLITDVNIKLLSVGFHFTIIIYMRA